MGVLRGAAGRQGKRAFGGWEELLAAGQGAWRVFRDNYLAYVRGNKSDYDLWEKQHGTKGWSSAEVLPLFKRSEAKTLSCLPWPRPTRIATGRADPLAFV